MSGCSHGGADDSEGSDATPGPVAVEVAAVNLAPMETVVSAQGLLVPGQGLDAKVAALASGKIAVVYVKEGDHVRAGQTLALLDNRMSQAQAEAAGAGANAAAADAQSASLEAQSAASDASTSLSTAAAGVQSALADRDAQVGSANADLDAAENDLRKAQLAAASPDAQVAVDQAQLALDAAQADRESSIATAQNDLDSALTDQAKLKNGARPVELAQAQTQVSSAQATRDRARGEVDRLTFLVGQGIKPQRDLDDAQTALQVAEANLASANDALTLLQAGARPEDLTAAELRVEAARAALIAARKGGNSHVAQAKSALSLAQADLNQASVARPADVHAAQAKLSSAQAALDDARKTGDAHVAQAQSALDASRAGALTVAAREADARSKAATQVAQGANYSVAQLNVAAGVLTAPISGIVIKRSADPGDNADPATPLFEIEDERTLDLTAQLPAQEAVAVAPGERAEVTVDTDPGQNFVARVASLGEVDPASGLLSVRLSVANPNGALKTGELGTAHIVTSHRDRALVVPSRAIVSRDGAPTVYVVSGDSAKEVKITTGAVTHGVGAANSDTDLTEVTSGLTSGQDVIVLGQYELDDGDKIKVTGGDSGGVKG